MKHGKVWSRMAKSMAPLMMQIHMLHAVSPTLFPSRGLELIVAETAIRC